MKTLRSMPPESYPVRWDSVDTAAGPVSFATDGARVARIHLGEARRDGTRPTPLDREVRRQIADYFAGRRREFDLPAAPELPRFTGAVLAAVARIPFGETRSYGEIAAAVGSPKAARAVGQAVGSNPLPLLIPCHRVLAAEGRIGGFGGGLPWKRFLLGLEGISAP
ncbi:MAG TPA: methylated-DNA--[protein]-cysteine S-methyltransferase [Planctomycetota bacterium]|nr:methylated-DNA--[protein]-cysteine S-methyltransferase [Planctomycetota bacterium]